MNKHDSFDWVDVLLRRWQIIVAIFGTIGWMTYLQAQVAYGTEQTADIKKDLRSLSAVQAEWPYLKEKVQNIDKKIDVLLSRTKLEAL